MNVQGVSNIAKPPEARINSQIRARDVRLIDVDGTQLGIKSIDEALRIAQNRGLDLVEIAALNSPPVCKLADFSKFRYEREKKLKEARKKQKGGQLKELRIRPKIGLHDLDIKINHMREFLEGRDKVRISVVFKGREFEHPELGQNLLIRVRDQLVDIAIVESPPSQDGKLLSMLLAPKR